MEEGVTNSNCVIDYNSKLILAPMVRVNQLPFRLLAKEYGADITYSEELIALKLRQTTRVINTYGNTVDFVLKDGSPVYRTCRLDHPNVVQLGAAEPVVALEAAQVVAQDVDAIDLNMGCPKHFSIQGGMGAALLSKPDTVKDILSTLKRNLNNPVTCKIRLLDSVSSTLDLIKIIEQTGVSAITVHARHISERPRDPAHWDNFAEIAQSALSVPLIVNGDVFKHEDIARVRQETGVSSVMIARGAMWNASIFQPEREDIDTVITKYLRKCIQFDNNFTNTKYVLLQMLQELTPRHAKEPATHSCKDWKTLSELWNVADYWKDVQQNVYHRDENQSVSKKKQKVANANK